MFHPIEFVFYRVSQFKCWVGHIASLFIGQWLTAIFWHFWNYCFDWFFCVKIVQQTLRKRDKFEGCYSLFLNHWFSDWSTGLHYIKNYGQIFNTVLRISEWTLCSEVPSIECHGLVSRIVKRMNWLNDLFLSTLSVREFQFITVIVSVRHSTSIGKIIELWFL